MTENTESEPGGHSQNFSSEADHNICARLLEDIQEFPEAYDKVKAGMSMHLTDAQLLQQLRDQGVGQMESSRDLDGNWRRFSEEGGWNG